MNSLILKLIDYPKILKFSTWIIGALFGFALHKLGGTSFLSGLQIDPGVLATAAASSGAVVAGIIAQALHVAPPPKTPDQIG